MKIVYAAGVFDILHGGHVRYLEAARKLGDFLIVGLLTDDGAAAYKDRPAMTYDERKEVVKALRCVDMVVLQDNTDPTATLERLEDLDIMIDILVRGTDYKKVPPGTRFVKSRGGKVVRLPYSKSISSTEIKERIQHPVGWHLQYI
ncbi:MAG TPA: adenylyltransferase/cytidyltransferase family protein [Spirochaetota bacterium]|nr:adenylyltransferase/cytidyltransferase family protein [Spirochaetota bacterium]